MCHDIETRDGRLVTDAAAADYGNGRTPEEEAVVQTRVATLLLLLVTARRRVKTRARCRRRRRLW